MPMLCNVIHVQQNEIRRDRIAEITRAKSLTNRCLTVIVRQYVSTIN